LKTVFFGNSVVCVLVDYIVPVCHYKDLVSDRLKRLSQLINLQVYLLTSMLMLMTDGHCMLFAKDH